VSNPRLVVIVGSFGLASNIVGLFLFHDHGHSHGGGHSHSHAPVKAPPSPRAEGDVAAPSESSTSTAVQTRHREDSVTSLYGHPAQTRAYVVKAAQDLGYERDESARLNGAAPAAGYGATEAHDHAGHSHDVEAAAPAHSHDDHDHGHSHGGHSHGSMNMRGVFLHVLGDALGNVGVIASGLFILETTYWWRFYSDPAISFLITIIIFSSARPLVKSASFILLQGVPPSVPLEEVREMLVQTDGVISIHELHVWQLSESTIIASMHVLVDCGPGQDERYMHIAQRLRNVLHSFGVHAATIQPEFVRGGLKTAARMSGVDVAPQETDEHGRLITPAGTLVEAELVSGTRGGMALLSLADSLPQSQNETACLISCGPEGSSCAEESCCPPPKGSTLAAGGSSPSASGSASRPRSTHSNHDGHAH
jgi:zinc transporter 1